MTGDNVLRELAAQFCLSAVGGNITRVNGAIEILFELLKAARDAGGNVDAVEEIKIDWRAQDRATKTKDAACPPLPTDEKIYTESEYSEACRLNVAVIGEEVGAPGVSLQGISEIVADVRHQNTRMKLLLEAVAKGEDGAVAKVKELLEERAMLARFAAIDRMYR